jgi:tetratricopeptide (TPR) repeat protein
VTRARAFTRRRRAAVVALSIAVVALALAAGCARRPPVRTEGPGGVPLPPGREMPRAGGERSHRIEHTVQPGETLAGIADNYYGDPQQAGEIAAANGLAPGARLAAGSTLVLRFDADEWSRAERRAAAMPAYNRGVDLLERGRLEEAESQFKTALDAAPDFPTARYNLALVWMKRGNYDRAESALADLLRQRPEDPDFLFAHGSVLFFQGRFPDAAAEFRRLLAVSPGHREGTFSLARSLQAAGRKREAIAAWEAYLRLDAKSHWADTARRSLRELRGG